MESYAKGRRWVRVALGVLLLLVPSCSVRHVPRPVEVDLGSVPQFAIAGSVELRNVQDPDLGTELSVSPYALPVNYREYTDAVISGLRDAIYARGGTVSTAGLKRLEVAVVDVKLNPTTARFRCLISANVRMGNGDLRGVQGEAVSWDFEKAIDGAAMETAVAILRDAKIQAYLTHGSSDASDPQD